MCIATALKRLHREKEQVLISARASKPVTVVLSFWGKGGVGKTTLSSSLAVRLAERGYRTLLISTDFVPSLGDVLGLEVPPRPTKVAENLYAEQLTEDSIIELWKQRFGEEVYRVASSIFPVGREVIDYVAGAPGIVEEFALYYVYERARSGGYDFLVWDTMATGGGLRMLRIEKEFYDHLGDAVKMYLKVKGVIEKIRTGAADPLELIESWRKLAYDVLEFLRSSSHRAFLVARPMYVDLQVARRVYQELLSFGIPLGGLFLNMHVREQPYLEVEEEYRRFLPQGFPIFTVPLLSRSPRGLEELRRLLSDVPLEELVQTGRA